MFSECISDCRAESVRPRSSSANYMFIFLHGLLRSYQELEEGGALSLVYRRMAVWARDGAHRTNWISMGIETEAGARGGGQQVEAPTRWAREEDQGGGGQTERMTRFGP